MAGNGYVIVMGSLLDGPPKAEPMTGLA